MCETQIGRPSLNKSAGHVHGRKSSRVAAEIAQSILTFAIILPESCTFARILHFFGGCQKPVTEVHGRIFSRGRNILLRGTTVQQSVASERLKRRWSERLVERFRWQTIGTQPGPPPDLMRRRRSDVARPTAKRLLHS